MGEYVRLRCAHLADHVNAAQAPGRLLLTELEAVLQDFERPRRGRG